jgi:ArsR family transcriptional regulator
MDEKYIDALKALSEPNRLRLFWLLVHIDKRISVAEAMDVIGDTQYNVSRNLKILYKAGLLTPKKQGKWVYYTLNEHKQPHWAFLVESIKMLPEDNFSDVTKRCLKRLAMRVNDECVIGANSDEWQSVINDNE